MREGRRRLNILVAEDNPVNQALVMRLLEKQGHGAVLVANGKEALATLEREAFDLVLMDVQMPEMDGLQATAAIRARERETGAHVPILALTAHALKGDRERCLAAGVDGYLSKPLRGEELEAAIRAVRGEDSCPRRPPGDGAEMAPPAEAAAPSPGPGPSPPASGEVPPLDLAAALATAVGDRALLDELVSVFLADSPHRLEALRQAVAAGDAKGVEEAAHGLKGALRILAATGAQARAAELEALGRADRVGEVPAAMAALERDLADLTEYLAGPAWRERT
jgi:CheY-like chemotaxis protein